MLDKLLTLEAPLFLWLNAQHSVWADNFMWAITTKWTWVPIIIALFVTMFYKTSARQAGIMLIMFILVITCADQFSDAVIKAYFQRLRPTYHPDFKHLVHIVNEYQGAPYGFVSSHAANTFAVAVFLHKSMQSKLLTFTIFLWAILLSYSRIYLGVHFISDVVGGAFVGVAIGYVGFKIHIVIRSALLDRFQAVKPFIPQKQINYFAILWLIYLISLLLVSF